MHRKFNVNVFFHHTDIWWFKYPSLKANKALLKAQFCIVGCVDCHIRLYSALDLLAHENFNILCSTKRHL